MELMTLDQNFQPNLILESYESLIWTERYSENGDFELKSNDIGTMLEALPRESYVTLRESTVPMMVEDHKIQKNPRGAPYITVTGRSFETVLERRVSVNSLPSSVARAAWTETAEKESDAAYKAMRVVLGDFPRYQDSTQVLPLVNPAVSPLDAISQIDLILPSDYSTLTTNTYEIKPNNLYSTVMELISTNHHGLKSIRPGRTSSKVGIEIYNGANLTGEGPNSDPSNVVVFDARFDQFDDTTYLFSERGSMNVAYVYGANGSQAVLKTAAAEPSGLARRVHLVDESGDDTTTTTDIRRTRGLIELYKYNATALFDGQIAQQIAAGYNTKYHLGDILKLVGEYGLSQDVRVAEFIRTSDATGEKAYPAFEAVG